MDNLGSLVQTIISTANAKGISLSELARNAGVARETVSRLQSRKDADFSVLQKLCLALELDIVAVPRKPRAKAASLRHPELSFPYDWSNSAMGADQLIAAVLERGIFSDVLAVTRHYGLRRVQKTYDKMQVQSGTTPLRDRSLDRMLRNIEAGFQGAGRRVKA